MPGSDPLEFPYMFWAQSESFRSPYCLAQSGMPPPEPALVGPLTAQELLAFPAVEALPRLEARIGDLFGVPAERVLVTPGASAAMLLVAMRFFRPPARVAVELPSYEALRALPPVFGADVRLVERQLERGWQLEPEGVERALAGAPGRGHLLLTNPHNPSGAVLGEPALAELAGVAARHSGLLVSCEAYMEYAPLAARHHAARLAPNALSIGTLTKAYGLGPLRIGWILLGAGLAAERVHLKDMAHLAYVDPATASLVAAHRALERLTELGAPIRRVERESRPHLLRWLQESAGVEALLPPFGILSFPRIAGVADTLGLQRYLAAEHGVDVVAGEYFGAPGHLRVACGVPQGTLVEALVRLERGIGAWRTGLARPPAVD